MLRPPRTLALGDSASKGDQPLDTARQPRMIDRDTTLGGRRLELGQKIDQDVVPRLKRAGVKRDARGSRSAA